MRNIFSYRIAQKTVQAALAATSTVSQFIPASPQPDVDVKACTVVGFKLVCEAPEKLRGKVFEAEVEAAGNVLEAQHTERVKVEAGSVRHAPTGPEVPLDADDRGPGRSPQPEGPAPARPQDPAPTRPQEPMPTRPQDLAPKAAPTDRRKSLDKDAEAHAVVGGSPPDVPDVDAADAIEPHQGDGPAFDGDWEPDLDD